LAKLVDDYGPAVVTLAIDVNDEEAAAKAVAISEDKFGRIDVLVNNAGGLVAGLCEQVDGTSFRQQFETNVFAVHSMTRAVLSGFRRRQSGTIVTVSSEAGFAAQGGFTAYSASKFAAEGLMEAVAAEVEGFGVRVIIVEPGPFRTSFGSQELATLPVCPEGYPEFGSWIERYASRLGDPSKAAQVILAAVDSPEPPLRLVLGGGALAHVRGKANRTLEDLTRWEALSISTDYEEPPPKH
jgi:NAD(P)-dependent dehydrogenase (short-subunit alcohol dehydrogenase family)